MTYINTSNSCGMSRVVNTMGTISVSVPSDSRRNESPSGTSFEICKPYSTDLTIQNTIDKMRPVTDMKDAILHPESEISEMTLVTVIFYLNGDTVIASDSRSTIQTEDNQYRYEDTEQKIFPIKDTPFILALSGTNRFLPNGSTIKSLVYSCKGMTDMHDIIECAETFLQTHLSQDNDSRILLINVSHPDLVITVHYANGILTRQKIILGEQHGYMIGSDWAITIAEKYAPGPSASSEEIARIQEMYDHLYQLSHMMINKYDVIAAPTQLWIGHVDGTIKKVE